MRTTFALTAVVLLTASTLTAGQERPRQRWPDGAGRGQQSGGARSGAPDGQDRGGRTASPREGGQTRGDDGQERTPRSAAPDRGGRAEDGQDRRGRRGGLPRRNGADLAEQQRERARAEEPRLRRPDTGGRVAVPRPVPLPPTDGRRIYGPPPARRYDPAPRRYRSWDTNPGYYLYYDPYYRYPNRAFVWYGDYGGYGFGYSTGDLHFEVHPSDAEVYVDGYYAGTVDDFDGWGQDLRLEEGPYHIEIVAEGYETASFDVRVQAGRRITFDRDLRPLAYGY